MGYMTSLRSLEVSSSSSIKVAGKSRRIFCRNGVDDADLSPCVHSLGRGKGHGEPRRRRSSGAASSKWVGRCPSPPANSCSSSIQSPSSSSGESFRMGLLWRRREGRFGVANGRRHRLLKGDRLDLPSPAGGVVREATLMLSRCSDESSKDLCFSLSARTGARGS